MSKLIHEELSGAIIGATVPGPTDRTHAAGSRWTFWLENGRRRFW